MIGSQTADLGNKICPMCLVEFRGAEFGDHCPGCRADGKKVPLMAVPVYLAQVDFVFVEEFWTNNRRAPADLRNRMLDRLAVLKEKQTREFGSALDVPLTRQPSDPRIKILN